MHFISFRMLAQTVSQSSFRTVTQLSRSITVKRYASSTDNPQLSKGEKEIVDRLKSNLSVTDLDVKDISGGCGSMYEIYVVAEEFRGKRTVQQHRLVNEILKEEVKGMHGLRIHTDVP